MSLAGDTHPAVAETQDPSGQTLLISTAFQRAGHGAHASLIHAKASPVASTVLYHVIRVLNKFTNRKFGI